MNVVDRSLAMFKTHRPTSQELPHSYLNGSSSVSWLHVCCCVLVHYCDCMLVNSTTVPFDIHMPSVNLSCNCMTQSAIYVKAQQSGMQWVGLKSRSGVTVWVYRWIECVLANHPTPNAQVLSGKALPWPRNLRSVFRSCLASQNILLNILL